VANDAHNRGGTISIEMGTTNVDSSSRRRSRKFATLDVRAEHVIDGDDGVVVEVDACPLASLSVPFFDRLYPSSYFEEEERGAQFIILDVPPSPPPPPPPPLPDIFAVIVGRVRKWGVIVAPVIYDDDDDDDDDDDGAPSPIPPRSWPSSSLRLCRWTLKRGVMTVVGVCDN
jgi:hypothetical protein